MECVRQERLRCVRRSNGKDDAGIMAAGNLGCSAANAGGGTGTEIVLPERSIRLAVGLADRRGSEEEEGWLRQTPSLMV